MLDGNKICFAIYDNGQTYSDNIVYISELYAADGMWPECMSAGQEGNKYEAYNEMMKASDAKYKVYCESDVYIVNKEFIRDAVDIFQADSTIGAISVKGEKYLPSGGKETYGKVIFDSLEEGVYVKEYLPVENQWKEVDEIEDFFIITACDIPWNSEEQDNCNKKHCRDLQRAGYKVVVAGQGKPWCIKEIRE